MKSHLPPTNSSSSDSFALISVLALVSLAALTATAFLASARLERQATMPLTQTTMLDMALDSGAVAALRLLEYGGAEQFNHVVTYWRGAGADDWTNELGYLLIGSLQSNDITSNPLKVKYYFCFSSAALTNLGTNLIEYTNHQSAGSQSQFNRQINNGLRTAQRGTNFAAGQSTNIPLLGDNPANRFTSPPVGWVYINQDVRVKPGQTNTTNVPVTRFAFYVQDLSSMIDADRMGGFTNGTPYRESTAMPANYAQGTNPAEISLTNLTGTVLTNSNNAANFTSATNRTKYLSPGMLVLSNAGKLNTNDLRYVTTGLRHWTNAFERIPFGLGYSNCGTSDKGTNKYNLATAANITVDAIAAHITSNLSTNFPDRAGGLTNNNRFDYAKCIAANIVDYIDSDSTPSIMTGADGYRGCEALPLVSEAAISIHWTNQVKTGVRYEEEIEVVHLVEFWNMFNKPFSGTVNFGMSNTFSARFVLNEFNPNKTSLRDPTSQGNLTNPYVIANLLPNEYRVFASPPIRYKVLSGIGLEPVWNKKTAKNGANVPLGRSGSTGSDNFTSGWTLSFNNVIYDQAINFEEIQNTTGLKCEAFNSASGAPPRFKAHIPALRLDASNSISSIYGTGDNRMNFFMTNATTVNGPAVFNASGFDDRGSFGYRNKVWGLTYSGSTNRPDLWLDGGHANSPLGGGATPGGSESRVYDKNGVVTAKFATVLALKTPSLAIQKEAPAYIADAPMTNIFELGRIFDPMQWQTALPDSSPPTNILTSTLPDYQQGGGNTLRIGRAEHQRFAWTKPSTTASDPSMPNMQKSAAALLDLFCISNQFDEGGKINLNTAPAPVLRALAGGIYLRSDPALLTNGSPAGTNFSIPPAMAEAFAQGVMRFRAKYPFYSPSQLSFIGTDPTWPNTNTWPTNAVFGNTNSIYLTNAPGNTFGTTASMAITEWNDQAAEEWFAKIFKLSTVYSRNFRVYVIAQKATTNSSGVFIGVGPVVRKYYNVLIRQNGSDAGEEPGASPVTTFQSYY